MTRRARIAAYAAALVALAAVFALYAQPQVRVALADMIWACFGGVP
jgi:hypothetical protein